MAWWDRHFALEHTYSYASLSIGLRASGLCNGEVFSLLSALGRFLGRVDDALDLRIELDAAESELSDAAAAWILDVLRRRLAKRKGGSCLRIVKLFKNNLGNAAASALAAWLWQQPEACEEIHLSHNQIGHRGMAQLLTALARHPREAYPRSVEHLDEAIPCWLRLEHNQAPGIEHLLSVLQKDPVRLRTCLAPRGEDRGTQPACTAFRCCHGSACKADTPHVHLYCVGKQKDDAELAEQPQLESMVLTLCDEVTAGCFDPVTEVVTPPYTAPTAPAAAVPIRAAVLRVDAEKGAGLEMTAHPFGYLVDNVEADPGQDLTPGDVLLAVDGEPLWGDLSEDQLNDVFGREFADGASVDVAPACEVEGSWLWQPLGSFPAGECRRRALREDLGIFGRTCGVAAELDDEGAVWMHGPPGALHRARTELQMLTRFYFPELDETALLPAFRWVKDEVQTGRRVEEQRKSDSPPRVPCEATEHPDMASWAVSLRQQWEEDDDLFDDDLPIEPLEAPDEGPDIFDGEVFMPELDLSRPFKMLILVGLPGAGKSRLSGRLAALGWEVVNQDQLGDRKACVAAAKEALAKSRRVVVDRCNATRLQRRVWLELAEDYEVGAACIWLDIPEDVCGARVLQRFGHETLPAEEKSLEVIAAFSRRLEAPMEAEGFVRWRVKEDDDLEDVFAEYQDLVQRSEAETLLVQPTEDDQVPRPRKRRRRLDDEAAAAGRAPSIEEVNLHSKAQRAQFLRVVRRQVEHYFSDRNLKKDWFFQEKIAAEPEPGWLQLRWIMSCPRIADVHRAAEQDVLEALKLSSLKVKEADGRNWIARTQPLPELEVPRPKKPEQLHDDVDQEEDCATDCDPDVLDETPDEDARIFCEQQWEEADIVVATESSKAADLELLRALDAREEAGADSDSDSGTEQLQVIVPAAAEPTGAGVAVQVGADSMAVLDQASEDPYL